MTATEPSPSGSRRREGLGTAASVAAAEVAAARHLERESRRSERKEELLEAFEVGSDEQKVCNKDRPGRESLRKKSKQPMHTAEELHSTWGHAKHKLHGLKTVRGGTMLPPDNLAPSRLPSMRERGPRGLNNASRRPSPALAAAQAAAAASSEPDAAAGPSGLQAFCMAIPGAQEGAPTPSTGKTVLDA